MFSKGWTPPLEGKVFFSHSDLDTKDFYLSSISSPLEIFSAAARSAEIEF